MILLWAVATGWLVGLGWARSQQVKYEVPVLHYLGLALAAFLPQYAVTFLPIRNTIPTWVVAICLLLSQALFLGFALLNHRHQGMKILMIGAALNIAVMLTNNGFMPISPNTASQLVSKDVLANLQAGSRLGPKDMLLSPAQTHLEWLADRFLSPTWFPHQVAFSLGDVFIAAGAFWLLAKQNAKGNNL